MTEEMFIDAEAEYSGRTEGTTFKEIALRHISKISEICSKELTKGYLQRKPVFMNGTTYMSEIWIEDKRKSFINAVDFLNDILLPHFDKQMQEQSSIIETEYKTKYKLYKENKKSKSEWIDKEVLIKRKLFQQLSLLLKRLGYLEGKKLSE